MAGVLSDRQLELKAKCLALKAKVKANSRDAETEVTIRLRHIQKELAELRRYIKRGSSFRETIAALKDIEFRVKHLAEHVADQVRLP